jgi:hypothetical protein
VFCAGQGKQAGWGVKRRHGFCKITVCTCAAAAGNLWLLGHPKILLLNPPKVNPAFLYPFLLSFGYFLALYLLQFFLFRLGFAATVPGAETLLRWDAGMYHDVAQHGYSYTDPKYNNTGSYLLFPMVWRVLHVGIEGITIVNMVLFSVAFAIVARLYLASTREQFLWLTLPSLYFIAAPYTEALFCLLSAGALYGILMNKKYIVWVSLFLLALTRANAIFLIPALLVMQLFTSSAAVMWRAIVEYLLYYALPLTCGLATFVIVQYYQTGIWFVYFKQQAAHLGHQWALPKLPFQNCFNGPKTIWLSGLAMFGCLAATAILMKIAYRWFRQRLSFTDKGVVLSMAYLAITLFSIVFCNPTWGEKGTTNIFGLHRYTLCTPFIFVLLHHTASSFKPSARNISFVFFLSNLVWLTTGSYVHIQELLYWNVATAILLLYLLRNRYEWAMLALIGFNILAQFGLYQAFLSNTFTD